MNGHLSSGQRCVCRQKKKNVGQRACTCVRATAGQRAAASNYDFLSSGTKRLQLHFREGRRVFFFSCHSLAEVVKYNLILLPLSLFFFSLREKIIYHAPVQEVAHNRHKLCILAASKNISVKASEAEIPAAVFSTADMRRDIRLLTLPNTTDCGLHTKAAN